MAVDENYLDNLLKSMNEKEAELEKTSGAAMSAMDRVRSMSHMNEPGMRSIFAEDPVEEAPVAVEPVIEEPVIEEPIVAEEPAVEIPVVDIPAFEEPIAVEEPVIEIPVEEPVIEEPVTEIPVEEPVIEETVAEEPASIEVTPVSDDPNAALTPDQIAAMFARVETPAEEPAVDIPAFEESIAVEEPVIEIPAEEPVIEEPVVEESTPIEVTPVSDDPNAALTPDQIAAMFAQVEAPAEEPVAETPAEEPVIEETVAEEPASIEVTPVSNDPNAALTPDQIAAMFAQIETPAEEPAVDIPAFEESIAVEEPVIETPAEEPVIEEPVVEEPAPIEVTPVSDDPNAALTPDQIAAMFAQVESPAEESETPAEESVVEEPVIEEPAAEEPAPIEITPVSDDPNAALTPDQIAAMFAQVETPAEEPAVETPAEEPAAEEPIVEIPTDELAVEEPVAEEPTPIEITPVSDDPNAALTPDQIAAMFSQVESPAEESETPAEEPVIEEPAADEPIVEIPTDELAVEEPVAEEPSISELLGEVLAEDEYAKDDNTMSQPEIEELFNPSKMSGDSLDDGFVPSEDAALGEIEELLSMSDNHELVTDNEEPALGEADLFADNLEGEIAVDEMDIDALLASANRSSSSSDFDDEESEEEKKEKKKKKKEKKSKKKKDKDENTSEDGEEKLGFFKRLVNALTEDVDDVNVDIAPEMIDIPENVAGVENIAILQELDAESDAPSGKKGKKGKKEKKKKEDDPKAKKKAEEAAKKKEEAKKAKAAKAAAAKEAKAAKAAAKAEKEAALGPIKKLPKKKVIMIFLVFVPILVGLLIIGFIVPQDIELKEARTAYENKEYDTTYKGMYGQKLNEDDKVMFDNSSCILQMRRWEKAYAAYSEIGWPREALDALISGVACYDYIHVHYNVTEVGPEIETSYSNILNILSSNYGITPEYARQVIASATDKEYTRYIDAILDGHTSGKPDPFANMNTDNGNDNEATDDGSEAQDSEQPTASSSDDSSEPADPEQEYWDQVYEALVNGETPPEAPEGVSGDTSGATPVNGNNNGNVVMEETVDSNGNPVNGNLNDNQPGNPDGSLIYEIHAQ